MTKDDILKENLQKVCGWLPQSLIDQLLDDNILEHAHRTISIEWKFTAANCKFAPFWLFIEIGDITMSIGFGDKYGWLYKDELCPIQHSNIESLLLKLKTYEMWFTI